MFKLCKPHRSQLIIHIIFALAVTSTSAMPLHSSTPFSGNSSLIIAGGTCYDYTIPVTFSAPGISWLTPHFSSNYDVVGFFQNLTQRDASTIFHPISISQNETTQRDYDIHATFCAPLGNRSHAETVLVATSGLGYDERYWASQFEPATYSFVEYALVRGYSAFIYDRLGTGQSSKVSGYTDAQSATQVQILTRLTRSIRAGQFTGHLGVPKRVVHIGHSFGSYLTHAFVATFPSLSDGIILTGIGYNASTTAFGTFLEGARLDTAASVAPGRWPGLDSGYLAFADVYGNAATFFHEGAYDKEALWYTQDIAQPLGIVEQVTGAVTSLLPEYGRLNFSAPVLILNGEHDVGNCGGNCYGVMEQPAGFIFASSRLLEVAVHPGAGHGINFNGNATGAYGVMIDFLGRSDL